jgi:hypothetical protein
MTEKKLNIYQRMHEVMKEIDYVQKSKPKDAKGLQYNFASHDSVTSTVRVPCVKHGIVYHPANIKYAQNGNRIELSMDVRFVNIDDPSDFADVPSVGHGIDTQDKGPGKAISYAVKYALLKAFGLETGDDPERDSIEHVPAMNPKDGLENETGLYPPEEQRRQYDKACEALMKADSLDEVRKFWTSEGQRIYNGLKTVKPDWAKDLVDRKDATKKHFELKGQ